MRSKTIQVENDDPTTEVKWDSPAVKFKTSLMTAEFISVKQADKTRG